MAISQLRSKRKSTGSRYKNSRKKKLYELGSEPTLTRLEKRVCFSARKLGGNRKLRLLSANEINLIDPKTKKAKKAHIKTVIENPANRHFVRRNILTKGTIVETEFGKAKITSRPGQEGTINGVLI
ncbi:MAG: 30S ribosomal protein S8e [Candidatus Woesearchaeota archaeon]